MTDLDVPHPRAAIIAVQLPGVDDGAFASSITELARLARTLGLEVVATITQRRSALHAATVLGTGKLAEVLKLTGAADGEEEEKDEDEEDEDEKDDSADEPPVVREPDED